MLTTTLNIDEIAVPKDSDIKAIMTQTVVNINILEISSG